MTESKTSAGTQVDPAGTLRRTPLHDLHLELGARMTPFAGYEMPVQYPDGVLKEHLHTRTKAGLFDVSHMGQAWLTASGVAKGDEGAHDAVAAAIETLVPGEVARLKRGAIRYSLLLNPQGGMLDDLMITRPAMASGDGALFLVVNAACKANDFAVIAAALDGRARLDVADDRALLALQGPRAAVVIDLIAPGASAQGFMTMRPVMWGDTPVLVSRCGYTGEDGFEISVPAADAERLARTLLAHEDVAPIGLGARDSLRLEAGLCLYGHDIDETTSPVEAALDFAIGKRRREEGGFPGADRILRELKEGPARLRVGLKPEGRAPVREGADILDVDGAVVGRVTSGGFGPTAEGPVAMGYVAARAGAPGTAVRLTLRGREVPAHVVELPFVPHRYYRG